MRPVFGSWTLLAGLVPAMATAAEPLGREHILRMAGCHHVTYYFHEDGTHDYFSAEKPEAIVNDELITVHEEAPGRITLQHATVTDDGMAVPHWHEVWTHGSGG